MNQKQKKINFPETLLYELLLLVIVMCCYDIIFFFEMLVKQQLNSVFNSARNRMKFT